MVFVDILEEHLEESDFLWHKRQKALVSPFYTLHGLIALEERLRAHLDGLVIGGDKVWSLMQRQSIPGLGKIFAVAVLTFESGDKSRIEEMISVSNASLEISHGVISALGWLPFPQVRMVLEGLLHSELTGLRRIAIAGFAIHRQDLGQALSKAIAAGDPLLKARALKAVGELGRIDLLSAVRAHFGNENDTCRFAAAWSAALLGDAGAVSVLRSFAEQGDIDAENAADLALRLMDIHSALAWQRSLINASETHRMAVIGAGVIGNPVLIPWLIEQMTIPEMARIAGEAFTMITGVDIASQGLEREKFEVVLAEATDEFVDDNMEMDVDEELPWPNPKSVHQWWAMHRSEFQTGVRHLMGKPITEAWMWQVLRTGKQRQRAAAAIELAILQPGRPLFNVKAPAFRQMELLAAMKTS